MNSDLTVAVDAMGGDLGPAIAVAAALRALASQPDLHIVLVGNADTLGVLTGAHKLLDERLFVRHASEVVTMDESPRDALRGKKDSSMRVAIELVRDGEAAACVSAGNTGALVATARFILKTLPGIDRPALISPIPAIGGHTHMLDLGANADCTATHLLQFAVMGAVIASDISGMKDPRVGLLNIGEEEIKGNEVIRETAALLHASNLNYVGFVEGDGIFSGNVDVVVTDGFTGNVALKTMEGASHMITRALVDAFSSGWAARAAGLAAAPVLRKMRATLDPRRYNGASLLGLRGTVIKSHGGADETAFGHALATAVVEARQGVPQHIDRLLADNALEQAV